MDRGRADDAERRRGGAGAGPRELRRGRAGALGHRGRGEVPGLHVRGSRRASRAPGAGHRRHQRAPSADEDVADAGRRDRGGGRGHPVSARCPAGRDRRGHRPCARAARGARSAGRDRGRDHRRGPARSQPPGHARLGAGGREPVSRPRHRYRRRAGRWRGGDTALATRAPGAASSLLLAWTAWRVAWRRWRGRREGRFRSVRLGSFASPFSRVPQRASTPRASPCSRSSWATSRAPEP